MRLFEIGGAATTGQQHEQRIGSAIALLELAEALPFPDAQFDAVLSTVMLHHLPRKTRQQCAHEIRRVLKPGGRVLAVDFGGAAQKRQTLFGRLHRHGYVTLKDIIAVLGEAGLNSVESGAVGISDLQFVLAAAQRRAFTNTAIGAKGMDAMKAHSHRLLTHAWMLPVGAVGLIAAHVILLRYVLPHAALSAAVVSGVITLVVIKHLGLLGSLFAQFRRWSRQ